MDSKKKKKKRNDKRFQEFIISVVKRKAYFAVFLVGNVAFSQLNPPTKPANLKTFFLHFLKSQIFRSIKVMNS